MKTRLSLAAAAIMLSVIVTGCATAISGTSRRIHVTSTPDNAEILVNGAVCGTTPSTVKVPVKSASITIRKDGYQTQTHSFEKTINPVFFLDILCWPTFFVDMSTEAMYNLSPTDVVIALATNRPQPIASTPSSTAAPWKPPSSYSFPSFTTEKRCSRCNQIVPITSHAGQMCPHCGAYWSTENTFPAFPRR